MASGKSTFIEKELSDKIGQSLYFDPDFLKPAIVQSAASKGQAYSLEDAHMESSIALELVRRARKSGLLPNASVVYSASRLYNDQIEEGLGHVARLTIHAIVADEANLIRSAAARDRKPADNALILRTRKEFIDSLRMLELYSGKPIDLHIHVRNAEGLKLYKSFNLEEENYISCLKTEGMKR